MTYVVKAEGLVATYIGNSFREAEEVYSKSRVTCTIFTIKGKGSLVPVAGKHKHIKHPNPAMKHAFGL
jgi:hypothetical protein